MRAVQDPKCRQFYRLYRETSVSHTHHLRVVQKTFFLFYSSWLPLTLSKDLCKTHLLHCLFFYLCLCCLSLQHPELDKYLLLFNPVSQRGHIPVQDSRFSGNDFIVGPIRKRTAKHWFFDTRQCPNMEGSCKGKIQCDSCFHATLQLFMLSFDEHLVLWGTVVILRSALDLACILTWVV